MQAILILVGYMGLGQYFPLFIVVRIGVFMGILIVFFVVIALFMCFGWLRREKLGV